MRRLIPVLAIILLLLLASAAGYYWVNHRPFSGTVCNVVEGDLIDVETRGNTRTIRLNGIDAPEKGQTFANEARNVARELTASQRVTVKSLGKDRYGRLIGNVFLPDGQMLNEVLVREGAAWWFRRYALGNQTLKALEQQAREAKRGLWAEEDPLAPWSYRDLVAEGKITPGDEETMVHVSSSDESYHREGCVCLGADDRIITLYKAKARNYKPCETCQP